MTLYKLPVTVTQMEIAKIVGLIDSLIADGQNEECEANLYSSRLHLVRALKELSHEPMAVQA